MIVKRKSPFTGKINEMDLDITPSQLMAHNCGNLIQDAFPNLTPGEREFIMTGITPQEWDEMFHDEDMEGEVTFF